MKAVLNLIEPYFESNRSLTVDNFFTSLALAEKLWAKKITLVGTMNVNKSAIPTSFLKSKSRMLLSSLFVFKDFLTLTSYVPKKNKSVILLSTHHHLDEIEYDNFQNKPEIIHFYNKNKVAVDTFDQCLEVNTVRRKTRRWPMTVFFMMVDSACHNSCAMTVLQKEKRNERIVDKERIKQKELEKLVRNLISDNARDRFEVFKSTNFKNVHKVVLDQVKKLIPSVI